jgi:hypothetical protein
MIWDCGQIANAKPFDSAQGDTKHLVVKVNTNRRAVILSGAEGLSVSYLSSVA